MSNNKNFVNIPPYWGYTDYTPVIPKFYWDVYSQEQRIKHLCKEYDRMSHYASYLAEQISAIEAVTPEELQSVETRVNSNLASLKQLIDALELSNVQWDVQHGIYTDTTTAQRDMFNDITYHSMTLEELDTLDITVGDLASCGLTVQGVAVASRWLNDKTTKLPAIYLYSE